MNARPSMLSLVQRANWLMTAVCPKCHETNLKGRKPPIELDERSQAWCSTCGADWPAELPKREVVE